jgi:hypothetical protein
LQRLTAIGAHIFVEITFFNEKIITMIKSFISFLLLLSQVQISHSQNSYSTYKSQTWEQVKGSGKLIQLNPSIDSFKSIVIQNVNMKINVETGSPVCALNISIDDNLKDFLKWTVKDQILTLSLDLSGGAQRRWLSENHSVITIKVPSIDNLINSGNGSIGMNFKTQKQFTLATDGNPDIKLAGQVGELTIQSNGNADIQAGHLLADRIILSSKGNADIKVNTQSLVRKEIEGNNDIVNLFVEQQTLQTTGSNNDAETLISIRLKNNSLLPGKYTLVSYQPGETGNGTQSFVLMSYSSRLFRFPVNTKLYLANKDQVNTVMSGASLTNQAPFLVIKKEDQGKTFLTK